MSIEQKIKTITFPMLGKISMVLFAVLFVIVGIWAYKLYGYIFKPNIQTDTELLIPTGASLRDVKKLVDENNMLINEHAFDWVSKRKKYGDNVKPGRYLFTKGMNTNEVVNKLRSGNQTPVKVTFNNVRSVGDLAGKVSSFLEGDSALFLATFTNDSILQSLGFDAKTFAALPIPNTYEFYWNTTPEKFLERMVDEHNSFWNDERIEKAKVQGFTPIGAATLASIVQEETAKNDEKAKIAGVYINRLKRGMPLQADPTVKYACGDFSIRRITKDMLAIDSPYNTYKNQGLPPGPICFPEITSIEAVLNPENHQYLFFCAKDDLSGYHSFARTLSAHNVNAARYHKALNAMQIFK